MCERESAWRQDYCRILQCLVASRNAMSGRIEKCFDEREREGKRADRSGIQTPPLKTANTVTNPTVYMVGIKEVARERRKRVRLFLSIYTIIIDSP